MPDSHTNALFTKALAEYRVGDYFGSLGWLKQCLEVSHLDPAETAATQFVLAMTHERLEQPDKARHWMQRGRKTVSGFVPTGGDSGNPAIRWQDWLMCDILHREAEELIAAKCNRFWRRR